MRHIARFPRWRRRCDFPRYRQIPREARRLSIGWYKTSRESPCSITGEIPRGDSRRREIARQCLAKFGPSRASRISAHGLLGGVFFSYSAILHIGVVYNPGTSLIFAVPAAVHIDKLARCRDTRTDFFELRIFESDERRAKATKGNTSALEATNKNGEDMEKLGGC